MGLIIGKLTGDYPSAIIGATAIDLDHLIPFARQKIIFNFKKIWQVTKMSQTSSRGVFHNFFAWVILTGLITLINVPIGLVFGLGYLSHFLLDAIDQDDFYPFYPFKKFNTHGFIAYYSRNEFIFTLLLLVIFFII